MKLSKHQKKMVEHLIYFIGEGRRPDLMNLLESVQSGNEGSIVSVEPSWPVYETYAKYMEAWVGKE